MEYKDFEKKFMELYETGISTTKICEILGEKRDRGYKLLHKKGLPSAKRYSEKYTKEFVDKIEKEYLEGATIRELEEKYPEYRGSINVYLKKRNVTRRRGNISNCNPHYFSSIDCPQKAYFLGFLMADGCITHKKGKENKTVKLELKIEDKYILEEFAKAIGSTLKVKESYGNNKPYKVNNKTYLNKKHNAYFSVGNVDLINDLEKYGCVPRKSFKVKKLPQISLELMRFFILGYYDGDGIASVGKQHYIGFVGTKEFLQNISKQIKTEIDLVEPNIYYNRFNKMYYLCYTSDEAQKALWHYFYDQTDFPCLTRKKEKMQKVLNIK